MNVYKSLFLGLVGLFFASCVEEYKIPTEFISISEMDIVINGRIIQGDKSVIYLSKTVPLYSEDEAESILNAHIKIVGKNGYESELAEFDIENDCYTIDTYHLPDNTLYSLKVEVEGETYQSEYVSLLKTPEIDEVTYKERNDGISIHVSSYDNGNASKYYLWTYEEDWEFHALVNWTALQLPVYDKKIYPGDFTDGSNPFFYCWKHTHSANIHLYNTGTLQENSVKEVELLRIPVEDNRISYIYSILVKQCSIDANAYNYYNTIKQYSENTNGLFTPMPMEIKGNVTCISNPNKRVIGYVLGSDIKSKRIFIYESDFETIESMYDPDCVTKRPPDPNSDAERGWQSVWRQMIEAGAVASTPTGKYEPLNNPEYRESVLYSRDCVDCRAVEGATKKRPDFWPNDHE